jgi:hypothetical protein
MQRDSDDGTKSHCLLGVHDQADTRGHSRLRYKGNGDFSQHARRPTMNDGRRRFGSRGADSSRPWPAGRLTREE